MLDEHDDDALQALMTNLGGHDMETVLDAFHGITDDRPTCFIAYTIKGYGLPLAGPQGQPRRADEPRPDGAVSARHGGAGGAGMGAVLGARPSGRGADRVFALDAARAERDAAYRNATASRCPTTSRRRAPGGSRRRKRSAAFSAASPRATASWFAARIVTTSPDVTVSTNLGAWVNRRGIFDRTERQTCSARRMSSRPQRWVMSPAGSTSSSASPSTISSCSWPRSAWPARFSARVCCRSARSTTRSSSAASMRSTTRSTRMRGSSWWRPRRASRWPPRAVRTNRSPNR